LISLETYFPIDLDYPVNKFNNLAKGLLLWYLAHPTFQGGTNIYDLNSLRNGTFNSSTYTAGKLLQGTTRPGGFASFVFNTNSPVSGSAKITFPTISLGSAANFSIAGWVNIDSASLSYGTFMANAGATQGFWMRKVGANFFFNAFFTADHLSTSSSPIGAWAHWVCTFDATAGPTNTFIKIYLNGNLDITIGPITVAATVPLEVIGSDSSNEAFIGKYDDLMVWNRVLSAVEAKQLYNSSRLGHPKLLNRVSPFANLLAGLKLGRVDLIGENNFTINPKMTLKSPINMDGECQINPFGRLTIKGGPSVLDGEAQLNTFPRLQIAGKTVLDGEAQILNTARLLIKGVASLDGEVQTNVVPRLKIAGKNILDGEAQISAVARMLLRGISGLDGEFQTGLVGTDTHSGTDLGIAALACELIATFNGTMKLSGKSILDGELQTGINGSRIISAKGLVLDGECILSSSGRLIYSGKSTLDGESSIVMTPRLLLGGKADLLEEAVLLAVSRMKMHGISSLDASSILVANLSKFISPSLTPRDIFNIVMYINKAVELDGNINRAIEFDMDR
jgi:hypothetical protein